jgi:hypothetical protein
MTSFYYDTCENTTTQTNLYQRATHDMKFKNKSVQILYDTVYSTEVEQLNYVPDICTKLLPLIKTVLVDYDAHIEASSTWKEFKCIDDHMSHKRFILMDFDSSLCFTLYSMIYR